MGLAGFGIGIAFFVQADIGVPPWDVFHQGIAEKANLGLGTVIIITGFALLLLWIPLRVRPGIGTILNAVQIGLVENIAEGIIPDASQPIVQIVYVFLGMVCIAAGSGLYIGAELGSGPRDGLMMGLNQRFGISVRISRTIVEVVAMSVGIILGGGIGIGTLIFAFGIGPMVQVALRVFHLSPQLVDAATGEALEQ
ncbi:MAG: hypothetical protein RIR69_1815 [Actinomycetota bacterium]